MCALRVNGLSPNETAHQELEKHGYHNEDES